MKFWPCILAFGLLSACNTAPQDRCDKQTYHNRACESREAQPRPARIRQIDAVTPRPSRPAPEPAANHQPAEDDNDFDDDEQGNKPREEDEEPESEDR